MTSRLVALLISTAVATAVVLVGVAGSSADSQVAQGNATERVSVSSTRKQGNDTSGYPALSADGRFVAFDSTASNLVLGDTNGLADVFVHDRQTGATERASVDSSGAEANGDSVISAISGDGRFVAFGSNASNLVPGDSNVSGDVFVHDRQTGATERVSVDSFGGEANGYSGSSAISAEGRFVGFDSRASNLVPGDTNGLVDVFVHDRQTGTTERVNVDSSGAEANGESLTIPAISAEGRFVAFSSNATNLVPGDNNQQFDVFVHDRQTGATERVSVDSFGGEANGQLFGSPALSADGRFVAFDSTASNLVLGDTNGLADVFVHDRQTGATERVNVDSSGAEANGDSIAAPAIRADRFVAFGSNASNLVPGDSNVSGDVFVHDRQTGATERVSVDCSGGEGNKGSDHSAITADGRFVAFESEATNLVPRDTNRRIDVFVHDRQAGSAPAIYSFAPMSGITGSKVRIDVARFDTVTKVTFDGKAAKFTILSAMQIQAKVPNGATTGKIRLTNADCTATSPSDYTVTFSITTLMPKSGPVGTAVTLTGVGFSDVTAVKFNGVPASFTILSPISIRATVPAGATTGKVTATSPQGAVTGPKFTVTTT